MLVHELMQHTMTESLGERKYKIGLLLKIQSGFFPPPQYLYVQLPETFHTTESQYVLESV